jgi:hypothetical protein
MSPRSARWSAVFLNSGGVALGSSRWRSDMNCSLKGWVANVRSLWKERRRSILLRTDMGMVESIMKWD